MQKIKKNKKIIVIFLVGITLALLAVVILAKGNKDEDSTGVNEDNRVQDDEIENIIPPSNTESQDTKLIEKEIVDSQGNRSESKYKYVNEENFTKFSYETYYSVCGKGRPDDFEYYTDHYEYKENEVIYINIVAQDITLGLGRDIPLFDGTYEFLKNLFDNKVFSNEEYLKYLYYTIGAASCGGSPTPDGILRELEYRGTEKAYYVLQYGSRHYLPRASEYPMSFLFISRIGNSYNVLMVRGNKLSTFLRPDNTLLACANSEGYIEPLNHACALDVINKSLDEEKVEQEVARILELFKLEEKDEL